MKKLCVVLVFDNVIRSTLRELPELTDATYWLVATQRSVLVLYLPPLCK